MAEQYIRFLKRGNTTIVDAKLTDARDSSAIEDATLEVTIRDADDVALTGEAWPVVVPHVGEGRYFASFSDEIEAELVTEYKAIVDVDSATAGVGYWELDVQFEDRD